MKHKKLEEILRLMLVISKKEAAPRTVTELAGLAFKGGATSLQLREKSMADRDFYEEARVVGDFCRRHGRAFIINDRADIALAADADGLHLGQGDLPVFQAARILPRHKILGVSARTEEEARAALEAGADYLGIGALFPTGSKDDASPVDPCELSAIIALGAPTVAIGGINKANAKDAWATGVNGLAVISALASSSDPKESAERLLGSRQ